MTRIEKETVLNALREYKKIAKTEQEKNITKAILTYWQDIVKAKSGSVTI